MLLRITALAVAASAMAAPSPALRVAALAAVTTATGPPFATSKELRPAARRTQEDAYQDALVGRKLKGLLAAALVCPLSLEIFQDPVIAADGHSYERREIEAWLARGKTTSPKTNAELPHAFLVPNRHLKAMCQQFLDEVREVEEAGG